MRKRLTPNFIKTAPKPDKGDRVIYWDERRPGFGLMVTSTGTRSFVFQYRNKQQISRRWTWSTDLPLLKARSEAKKIAGLVEMGKDPVAERREVRDAARQAATNTLKAVAEMYLTREGKKPVNERLRSLDQKRDVLERLIYPHLGNRPIGEIRRGDITRVLDKVEDENGPSAAHVALIHLSALFTWNAKRDEGFQNPIVRGMRPRANGDRDRVLDDGELRVVWRTAEAAPGPFSAYIRFLLLTAVRRIEASDMRWEEVIGDLWTVPKERMKGKAGNVYEHGVPLSGAARAILGDLKKLGPYVFTHNGKTPVSGFSTSKAKFDRQVMAMLRQQDPEAKQLPNWTLHDLRRTARTLMSRAGIQPDICERVLAHKIGGIRETYDRYSYLPEKRHALEALAALIDRVVTPPADNVTSLDEQRAKVAKS